MKLALPVLGLLLLSAVPSAAQPGYGGPQQCFWPRQINTYEVVRGRQDAVRITANVSDVYEVQARGCRNIDFSATIGLVNRGVSERICAGNPQNLELSVQQTAGFAPLRCQVTSIRRVSPAELADERTRR